MNGGRGLRDRQQVAEEADRSWKRLGGVKIMGEARSKTRARAATRFFDSPVLFRREMKSSESRGGRRCGSSWEMYLVFCVERVPRSVDRRGLMYCDRGIERKCSSTFRDLSG